MVKYMFYVLAIFRKVEFLMQDKCFGTLVQISLPTSKNRAVNLTLFFIFKKYPFFVSQINRKLSFLQNGFGKKKNDNKENRIICKVSDSQKYLTNVQSCNNYLKWVLACFGFDGKRRTAKISIQIKTAGLAQRTCKMFIHNCGRVPREIAQ